MSVKIRDTDHGYKRLVEQVFGMSKRKPRIDVGILEADGARAHDGDLTVIEVAVINEFGGSDSDPPARSFIRAWFDESEGEVREKLVGRMKAVIAGDITREQALEQVALWAVGQIQARIASGIAPPNAPSTIAQKGSSTPLIGETGQLRSSVSHRVREQ
jgi:hypothetical protein